MVSSFLDWARAGPRGTGIIKALPLLLRSRETMVHAIVAQILPDWRATATGQTRSDVIQLLALLNAWLDDEPRPASRRPRRRACLTSQAHRILDQGG